MIEADPYTAPEAERSQATTRLPTFLSAAFGVLLCLAFVLGILGSGMALTGLSADFVSFNFFPMDSGPSMSSGVVAGETLFAVGIGLVVGSLLAASAILFVLYRVRRRTRR